MQQFTNESTPFSSLILVFGSTLGLFCGIRLLGPFLNSLYHHVSTSDDLNQFNVGNPNRATPGPIYEELFDDLPEKEYNLPATIKINDEMLEELHHTEFTDPISFECYSSNDTPLVLVNPQKSSDFYQVYHLNIWKNCLQIRANSSIVMNDPMTNIELTKDNSRIIYTTLGDLHNYFSLSRPLSP